MLVLKVPIGDSIRIGDDIAITVTDVVRNQVKLGIEAPREVVVLREELSKAQNNLGTKIR